jgi:sigma-B regulation protein RsbU (phosphoserine phosphatase)
VWNVPGPFLGTADTSYLNVIGDLVAGDRLVFGTDGTRPDGEPTADGAPDLLSTSAARHRAHAGQVFVDAIARDLLPRVRHPDDFTLLALEMVAVAGP